MLFLSCFSALEPGSAASIEVSDAVEVAVSDSGFSHAGCYRTQAGQVFCWGDSNVALNFVGPQPGPWPVVLPQKAVSLAAYGNGHCAILEDGDVACWRGYWEPAKRVGVEKVVALAGGAGHLCAIQQQGSVICWGDNLNGQTGQPAKQGLQPPMPVSDVQDAVAVTAGGAASCVVRASGTVWCFGNYPLRISEKDYVQSALPREVSELQGSRRVALGYDFLCQESQSGRVACSEGAESVEVPGLGPTSGLAAGGSWACGIEKGAVVCAGRGPVPGTMTSMQSQSISAHGKHAWKVENLQNVIGISVFTRYACAVTQGGGIQCWGYGSWGELGDGEVHESPYRATAVIRYAPELLPEPIGGINGCIASEALRRSCRASGLDCRLSAPPGYWSTPPSGVDHTGDSAWLEEQRKMLEVRDVPGCMCTCDPAYIEAMQKWQEHMQNSCCPP